MTYWAYGAYNHPAGEINVVNLTVRNVHSGRGQQKHVLFTYHLRGEICNASTTAEITARLIELEQVYSVEGQNCGLFIDASTPTAHILRNDHPNNISGNRVIQRPSYPEGGAVEYATGRVYTIVIQAVFASPESQILEYNERIQYVGDGGPLVDVRNMVRGAPRLYPRCERTAQRIIQSGNSVGFNGYVEPLGPIFPSYEHRDQQTWIYGTPEFKGQQYSEYPMQWAFYMSSPVGNAVPPLPI